MQLTALIALALVGAVLVPMAFRAREARRAWGRAWWLDEPPSLVDEEPIYTGGSWAELDAQISVREGCPTGPISLETWTDDQVNAYMRERLEAKMSALPHTVRPMTMWRMSDGAIARVCSVLNDRIRYVHHAEIVESTASDFLTIAEPID